METLLSEQEIEFLQNKNFRGAQISFVKRTGKSNTEFTELVRNWIIKRKETKNEFVPTQQRRVLQRNR